MELLNADGLSPAWILGKIRPPQWSITVMAKGTYRLVPEGTAVPRDKGLLVTGESFEDEDPTRPLRYDSDFAPWKPRTDLLLVGTCHAPLGKPTPACRVTFRVGTWSKSLQVTGDRPAPSSLPRPFVSMPIGYDRAFGGPSFNLNPLGRGFQGLGGVPNVQDPAHPILDLQGKHQPAGFGPIPLSWPQRMTRCGSHAGKWLRDRWPWHPEDFDWGFYNSAPIDQQVETLRGDEELEFHHLHPKHSVYRSRLPGIRPRWFINERVSEGAHRLHEVRMNLDTLWVDMDTETLVLVWRGTKEVRDEELTGWDHAWLAAEPLRSPKSLEECARRIEVFLKARENPRERREAPEPPASGLSQAAPPLPSVDWTAANPHVAEAEALAQTEWRKAGFPPAPEALPPEDYEDQVLDALVRAGEVLRSQNLEIPAVLSGAIASPPKIPRLSVPAVPRESAPTPPTSWTERLTRRESLEGVDLTEACLVGLDLRGMNLRGTVLRFASLRHANLGGADLSGAVLAEADLTGAICRNAVFRRADLAEAELAGIDLTDADLTEADFSRSDLSRATLAGVRADGSVWTKAHLAEVDFRRAHLSSADFSSALLDGARFDQATLAGARLAACRAEGISGEETDLTKACLSGADLSAGRFLRVRGDESVWNRAVLRRCDLSFSRFRRASFQGSGMEEARLVSADLRGSSFARANLHRASLDRANLFGAILERADLSGADFREANLYDVETWEAKLEGADFRRANLRRSKLARLEVEP